MTVTADQFLAGMKRLVTVPANQNRLNDADLYSIALDRLRSTVVPDIVSVAEEYFVTASYLPIVAGQTDYSIPARAVGRKLRDIKFRDSSGGYYGNFPKVALERANLYRGPGSSFGFFFYGDSIRLVPAPTGAGMEIELWWFLSPGRPVKVSEAGLITGVVGDNITLASVPASFTIGRKVDAVKGEGGSYVQIDRTITNVAGNTLSFAPGTVSARLGADDYLTLNGTSPIAQIPDEAVPYWQMLTAYDVCGAISDFKGQQALKPDIKQMKEDLLKLISPRINGEPTIIINDHGFLGRRGRRWGSVLFRG